MAGGARVLEPRAPPRAVVAEVRDVAHEPPAVDALVQRRLRSVWQEGPRRADVDARRLAARPAGESEVGAFRLQRQWTEVTRQARRGNAAPLLAHEARRAYKTVAQTSARVARRLVRKECARGTRDRLGGGLWTVVAGRADSVAHRRNNGVVGRAHKINRLDHAHRRFPADVARIDVAARGIGRLHAGCGHRPRHRRRQGWPRSIGHKV
mmetsp:Transcript_4723/g.14422  ORF Transcript_4723/g.14422 Transcript_4723/m.14422 type:complete len:209 (-) Transcript_4723:3561-4187(-)